MSKDNGHKRKPEVKINANSFNSMQQGEKEILRKATLKY